MTARPPDIPAVTLVPVGRDSYDRVAHIIVAPEQIRFSGTVNEAFRVDEAGVDFHAIEAAGRAVGFFKIDRHYPRRVGLARRGELGLRAFLVDLGAQGRGIGTAAVRALPGYLAARYPDARAVVLTVNFINPAARAAYLRGGFRDTGRVWPHGIAGPQHFLRMALR